MHPTPTADDWSELPDDPIVLLERWLPRNDDPERPLMTLATIDAAGHADLSPKGDPAGSMAHIDGDRFWFADRPGNRRAYSLRRDKC